MSAQVILFPIRGPWDWRKIRPGWWAGTAPDHERYVEAHKLPTGLWVYRWIGLEVWYTATTLREVRERTAGEWRFRREEIPCV